MAEVSVQPANPRQLRSDLLEAGVGGRDFAAAYAGAVDAWLKELFGRLVGGVDEPGVALLAVGGYGRGELCPGSDLDLVFLHDSERAAHGMPEALWYPVWDAGFHLDHSVRTPREVVAMAAKDPKVALGLLTGRRIAGDPILARHVLERARGDWVMRPRTSLGRLREMVEQRWRTSGDLAFLLEPDLKQSRGGLRDVEALRAAALATPVARGSLREPAFHDAHDTLLGVRVALHAVTGRSRDILSWEDQAAVATQLGVRDRSALMDVVASSGRRLAWVAEDTWDRIQSSLRGPGRRSERDRPLEPGIVLRDGEVALDAGASVSRDDSLPFRLAAAAARAGVPVCRPALGRLAAETPPPGKPWSSATRHALVNLLGCGPAAVRHLETLDNIGVLCAYLPEWEAVRNRPQRSTYHLYTVDRHLLETAAQAALLVRRVHRPDLLLVGALLHDIGKGRERDHTTVGVELVSTIAARMGFDAAEVETLETLVREHLLLPRMATRRDLKDPATVAAVAARIGTVEQLELLAALAEADALATGPSAWSAWKAGLIAELVIRTRDWLGGAPTPAPVALPSGEHRSLMAERRLRVIPEGETLTIVAVDRPGLLAAVAGVLALHRLSIWSAVAASEDGMAVDVFELDTGRVAVPDWSRVEREIALAIEDPTLLGRRFDDRARAARPVRGVPVSGTDVVIDNEATAMATVMEVRTEDAPGVLYKLALVLAEAGLDIISAKVETLGHEVVDTFYVREVRSGRKLTDPTIIEDVVAAIVAGVP
jgi:[protein-PII] uridylyltransferase